MNDPATAPGFDEEALRLVVEDIHRRFMEQGERAITVDDWDAYHNACRCLVQRGWQTRAVKKIVLERVVLEPIKSVGTPNRGGCNPSSPISSCLR